ncbi:MAG: lytic murein transglycosylase [Candidatus Pacebacteria bacterium]|nr:lytic murein transglycosylase [Candidatus Paceibacterota bacterium]
MLIIGALVASIFGTVLVASPRVLFAQTSGTSSSASTSSSSSDVAAKRAALQAQLNQLDAEIAQTQSTLNTLGSQDKSLSNQISTLNAQIKKSQLQLQATQVQIEALQSNIVIHSNTITTLSGQLDSEQQSLAQIIRQTDAIDHYSLVEVVLSAQDVSSFFGDLDSFDAIKQELGSSYTQITTTVSATQNEKLALEDQQTQAQQLATEQKLEENQIKSEEAQKQVLLSQTKSQEATYQGIYKVQQQTIAQIQAELFALAGGSGQISLPTAISLAKTAGADTGVDPALILGILKQETNIGQNVGTANYLDAMSPTRDVPEFLFITKLLGIDPNSVKVSAAPSYGWGGAMGPAQFIPSTWACYAGIVNSTTGVCGKGTDGTYAGPWEYNASKDRIAKLAGHPSSPSNPWNNLDAFVAVGLLMSDNGAPADIGNSPGCPSSGCEAALRYFAGWGNADNPAYAFYGDDVMAFAAQFKSDISTLAGQ